MFGTENGTRMKKHRYLTKSRFKLAMECPTKLFYTGKKEYPSTKLDDPFLQALANGGHQVGELAKCYYPDGIEVTSLDYDESEKQTLELLERDEVIIFEPAIRFGNLFIRIDILIKKGNCFELIEVKAKSYSSQKDAGFLNKSDRVDSKWLSYLQDVAFQKYVLQGAFPKASIASYLMLVDKESTCPTNGLNQKFKLVVDDSGRRKVNLSVPLTDEELSNQILRKVAVDGVVRKIYDTELTENRVDSSFIENIKALEQHYKEDKRVAEVIGTKCKACEYRCSSEEASNGYINGFKACWKNQLHWTDRDFENGSILDIWNFKGAKKLFSQNVIKLKDVTEENIGVSASSDLALSPKERQWIQVKKIKEGDRSIYFETEGMRREMASWVYPLHFIDFETSAVAIPFYKGMRPYEGIAFQFSHHIVHSDGRVEHAGQFLNAEVGQFPNFDFVRELKKQLENDSGSIFMYSPHENSTLNLIGRQLIVSNESDKDELCAFIKTITRSPKSVKKAGEMWCGDRAMIDLLDLVKKYYYDPEMGGSNSIKYVLPAILNSSQYLKDKYCQPIYGTNELPSLNLNNKSWIQYDSAGKVIDPYKNLPRMFQGISEHDIELLSETDELNNGGLALTAYGKLQFTEMSDYEREELKKALLTYCELDTFAMVVIFEAWREMINE